VDTALGTDPTPRGEVEAGVLAGERLDEAAARTLAAADDMAWLGRLAHFARTARHGDQTLFAPVGRLDLGTEANRAPAGALAQAREWAAAGVTEVRLVAAPDLPLSGHLEVLRALAAEAPALALAGLSAADLAGFADAEGRAVEEIAGDLVGAGLRLLGGDPGDARPDLLAVHRAAHGGGLPSVVLVPAGDALVDALLAVREVQDSTAGFRAAGVRPDADALPLAGLRAVAVTRLVLDGVDHVAVDATAIGLSTAQLALNFGADVLEGVDAATAGGTDLDDVLELIWDAQLRPVRRDTGYGPARRYEPAQPLAERRAQPQKVWD
jgi:aminodeoxyfutalosine synthase